jgi:hypothetical protein
MLVFYRGLHCPICKGYLRDLDRKPSSPRRTTPRAARLDRPEGAEKISLSLYRVQGLAFRHC